MDYFRVTAVTACCIIPGGVSVLPKPDVKSVKKDAIRIIWIDCDTLVVPVLIVIGIAATTVGKSRPGRAGNLYPRGPAIR